MILPFIFWHWNITSQTHEVLSQRFVFIEGKVIQLTLPPQNNKTISSANYPRTSQLSHIYFPTKSLMSSSIPGILLDNRPRERPSPFLADHRRILPLAIYIINLIKWSLIGYRGKTEENPLNTCPCAASEDFSNTKNASEKNKKPPHLHFTYFSWEPSFLDGAQWEAMSRSGFLVFGYASESKQSLKWDE